MFFTVLGPALSFIAHGVYVDVTESGVHVHPDQDDDPLQGARVR